VPRGVQFALQDFGRGAGQRNAPSGCCGIAKALRNLFQARLAVSTAHSWVGCQPALDSQSRLGISNSPASAELRAPRQRPSTVFCQNQ
jgi:hypothetical protein